MRLTCPECGKTVESPVELADGQRVQCPYCLVKFTYGDPKADAAASVQTIVSRKLAADVMATVREDLAAAAHAQASRGKPSHGKVPHAKLPHAKPSHAKPARGAKPPAPPRRGAPALDAAEEGEGGGGGKRLLTFALWLVFIGAAVCCLPKLKTAVERHVAPEKAWTQDFSPVYLEDDVPGVRSRASSSARRSHAEYDGGEAPKPTVVGARLGFCTDPRKLGKSVFAKRFGDVGTLYATGDRAYFCPAKTNAVLALEGLPMPFDPTDGVLGDVRKAVEALELDTSRAHFRVKVGRVDTRREGEAKYSRRVDWITAADVPYGAKVDRATLVQAVAALQQQWARKRATEMHPLDEELKVSVQVYDGRKIYFNDATRKWLLPRYRAKCDDKAAWDRVNGKLEGEQKRFKAHRQQVRAQRRQWYENHVSGEHLFNAVRLAEVSVEPHERDASAPVAASAPAPAPSPVAAREPVAAPPPAQDAPPVAEEPVRPLAETRPAPAAKPAPKAEPAAGKAAAEDPDLVEYDDDF